MTLLYMIDLNMSDDGHRFDEIQDSEDNDHDWRLVNRRTHTRKDKKPDAQEALLQANSVQMSSDEVEEEEGGNGQSASD